VDAVGLDVGFGFTKATNGRETLIFKSVYGEATDIPIREQFIEGQAQENYLHIVHEGQELFIGELAERQSTVRFFTLEPQRFISQFVKPLALAALSRLVERNIPVNLVTGLPVGQFRQQREELIQQLQGRHQLQICDRSGERRDTVICINKIRVVPQPFGSLFNLTLNELGEANERRYLQEKVGVVDVGFRTADYTVAQRSNYSNRGSRTTDAGISTAFATIADKLQEQCGVRVELYRLYDAVEHGSIKVHGKRYDIKAMAGQVLGRLAADIATEVNTLWNDDWDIDAILVSGGGGGALTPYLKPLLHGEIIPLPGGDDARLNNVRGYLKYGRHLWARGKAPLNSRATHSPRPLKSDS